MTVGTKSLLFGVHAFWWHPIVVFLAWCKLYGKYPTFPELLGILLHDIGYWGCPDMDGEQGKAHPERGARLVGWIVTKLYGEEEGMEAHRFTAMHSASFAERWGRDPSRLCAPDKYSICFEPKWFYLLRARLTGELDEYITNSPEHSEPDAWFDWLSNKFKDRYGSPKKS